MVIKQHICNSYTGHIHWITIAHINSSLFRSQKYFLCNMWCDKCMVWFFVNVLTRQRRQGLCNKVCLNHTGLSSTVLGSTLTNLKKRKSEWREQNNLSCSVKDPPACLCAFVIPKGTFTQRSVARQKCFQQHAFQWKDMAASSQCPDILCPDCFKKLEIKCWWWDTASKLQP